MPVYHSVLNRFLNVLVPIGTFNKEKALVGALAFSVVVKHREGSLSALLRARRGCMCRVRDYAAQPVVIIKTYAGAGA